MEYMTTKEALIKGNISERRIRKLEELKEQLIVNYNHLMSSHPIIRATLLPG